LNWHERLLKSPAPLCQRGDGERSGLKGLEERSCGTLGALRLKLPVSAALTLGTIGTFFICPLYRFSSFLPPPGGSPAAGNRAPGPRPGRPLSTQCLISSVPATSASKITDPSGRTLTFWLGCQVFFRDVAGDVLPEPDFYVGERAVNTPKLDFRNSSMFNPPAPQRSRRSGETPDPVQGEHADVLPQPQWPRM